LLRADNLIHHTLSDLRFLTLLVLGDLVASVLLALSAVGSDGLGAVDLDTLERIL